MFVILSAVVVFIYSFNKNVAMRKMKNSMLLYCTFLVILWVILKRVKI